MGKKKYEFSVELVVKELNQVPYANGVFFAKLRLLDGGGGGNFVAFSNKESIAKNKVVWNWRSVFDAKLNSDSETGVLAAKFCRISIRREIFTWKVTSKKMGFFDINLAEHARGGLVSLKRILEGYDSKNMDNSMLHVTLEMKLMKGDPCYKVPNLSRIDDPFEDLDTSGSNWYHDIGTINFQGAYHNDATGNAAPTTSSDGDAKINFRDDDDDDDDDDDSAFVTANDVSVEPLESSRKMSFSSPDVASIGIDDFISPIPSSPTNERRLNPSSNHHLHISSTPPIKPRRNRNGGGSTKKKTSSDLGVLQGGAGILSASASSMRYAIHRRQPSGGGGVNSTSMPPPSEPTASLPGQQQQPPSSAASTNEGTSTWKRGHKRDISAGTKSTMLWLKASEEYAEERRRRADLPPCVSADEVVADLLEEFDAVKKSNVDFSYPTKNATGLKLSDVQ